MLTKYNYLYLFEKIIPPSSGCYQAEVAPNIPEPTTFPSPVDQMAKPSKLTTDNYESSSKLPQRYSELDQKCKVCEKFFKRMKQHLNHSKSCQKRYDMEEFETKLKDQKREQARVRQMLHRKNAMDDVEEAFIESQTRENQSQKSTKMTDNEEGLRQKPDGEKQFQRSPVRSDNEEGFREKKSNRIQNISSDESDDSSILVTKLKKKRLTLNDDIDINSSQTSISNDINRNTKDSKANQIYSELDHKCKGCEKFFKRIKPHLNHSKSCQKNMI